MSLDPITAGIDFAKDVVNKIWPDKTDQEKAELAATLTVIQGQIDTNKAEAATGNLFIGGWRPAIGWICGMALFYTYLAYPLLIWAAGIWRPELKPPALSNDGMLYELLFCMLGLGGLRTFEKVKGVAK